MAETIFLGKVEINNHETIFLDEVEINNHTYMACFDIQLSKMKIRTNKTGICIYYCYHIFISKRISKS